MSKKLWFNHLTLILTGVIFIQFTVGNMVFSRSAQAADPQLTGLIGQLSPNDPCAWWNTTNPNNCTSSNSGTNNSSSTNPDPWNWGGDDPIWNNNGPDNGVWGGNDPNNSFTSSWTSTPQINLSFVEKIFRGSLSSNYYDRLSKTINDNGIWDQSTIDTAADKIIKDAALPVAIYAGIGTSAMYAMNALNGKLWKSLLGYTLGTFGAGTLVILPEAWAVADKQLVMVMELMELYGQLPTNISQRADALATVMGLGISEAFLTKALTIALKLPDLDAPDTPPVDPNPIGPVNPVPPQPPSAVTAVVPDIEKATGVTETQVQAAIEGQGTHGVAEKVANSLDKPGIWKGLSSKFGSKFATSVKARWSTMSPLGKVFLSVIFLSALSGVTAYTVTRVLGKIEKRRVSIAAAEHKHNILASFGNDVDAKDAIWLILTKYVFRPDRSDDALAPDEAKLYAAIVSQKLPLVHFRGHSEEASLFSSYRLSGVPGTVPSNTMPPVLSSSQSKDVTNTKEDKKSNTTNVFSGSNGDWTNVFGSGSNTGKSSSTTTPKLSTEIDDILMRLGEEYSITHNDEARLYFIQIIACGMLMKGFYTDRDSRTLETIAIELGIKPPKTVILKDNDPRTFLIQRFYALKKGLYGEVQKKVLIYGARSSQEKAKAGEFLDKADYGYVSGEIMLQDFYDPKEKVLTDAEFRKGVSGFSDQQDVNYENKVVDPILVGDKKVQPPTKLYPKHTTDGSPYPWDQDALSMVEAQHHQAQH